MKGHPVGFGWSVATSFAALVILIMWYGYSLLNEPPPITDQARGLVNDTVEQGGYLTVKNAFTMEKRCAGFFNRSIYTDSGLRIYSESEYRPVIAEELKRQIESFRTIHIPDDAPPGGAHYSSVVEWICNPMQRIWPQEQVLPELEFIIVPRQARSHG